MNSSEITELMNLAGPLVRTPFDTWCENFANLIEQSVIKRLSAGTPQTTGNIVMDSYKQMVAMKEAAPQGCAVVQCVQGE